jgi:hypothetical protein
VFVTGYLERKSGALKENIEKIWAR